MSFELLGIVLQPFRFFLLHLGEEFAWTFIGWVVGILAGVVVAFFRGRIVNFALFGGAIGALDMFVLYKLSSGDHAGGGVAGLSHDFLGKRERSWLAALSMAPASFGE